MVSAIMMDAATRTATRAEMMADIGAVGWGSYGHLALDAWTQAAAATSSALSQALPEIGGASHAAGLYSRAPDSMRSALRNMFSHLAASYLLTAFLGGTHPRS